LKKKFRSFEDARKFVHTLKFKGQKNWVEYCRTGNRPDDIPSNPNQVYMKQFSGYGDWLGTGIPSPGSITWKSFEEARKFVHALELKSSNEWVNYRKSGKMPKDMPSAPWRVYKNKGWIGFGDWLGTGTIAPQQREFRSFEEARKFVHSLKFKGQKEWRKYSMSGKRPDDIPATPNQVYKNKGWVSFGDWVGNRNISPTKRKFKSFVEARKFIHSLQLKGSQDWRNYFKSEKMPLDIPSHPHIIYKKEWQGWGDWFGTGRIATNIIKLKYREFSDARKLVHTLGLKNAKQFRQQASKYPRKNIPPDIPSHPYLVYKKEWIGWGDWLGTYSLSSRNRKYREFSDVRKFVHALELKTQREWQKFSNSDKRPDDIPGNPQKIYKKDWEGWGDWLGTYSIATRDIPYRTFRDAREFIRSLGLKNSIEWKEYCKSGKKPFDIPANPWVTYSKEKVSRITKINDKEI